MKRTVSARAALLVALLCAGISAMAAQVFVPAGSSLTLPSGVLGLSCADLTLQGNMSAGSSQVGLAGNVTIAPTGALNAGAGTLTVGGNWANTGTFTAGTSTVSFVDGCTSSSGQISGNTAFANLTFTSVTGRTFVLPVASAISASGQVTVAGAPGLAIQLVSADPAQPSFIVLGSGAGVVFTNAQLGTNVAFNGTAIPRLANISTRVQVQTGNDVLIGGFVINGFAPKRVAIVATGPSLAQYGIANALANPTLTLVRQSDQAVIGTNDDWQTAANAATLQSLGLAPPNALESAILADLAPGAYTAIVSGAGGGTGVGIVAVYEADHAEIPLINIATRGRVITGNDVMIGGFIIQGAAPQMVAIVATGPSLTQYGIANALANPTLTLVRQSDQAVLATNDDWQSAGNAAQLQSLGFAPSNTLESAILVTLPPGAYTAILSGAGGGTGVGIIAVYDANP